MSHPSSLATQPRRLRRVRARRAQRLRGFVGTALGAVVLMFLSLSGVGGSYALWSDSDTLGAGTVETGSVGLDAQWSPGHSDNPWSNMLPGESVRQPLTLSNTGDVPLAVKAAVNAVAGYELRVAVGRCTTQLAVRALGATPAPLVTIPTDDAGDDVTVCVEVRATSALRPGTSAAFTLTFDGMQVTS
ncbi:hypothetical protein [Microbacterium sp. JZ31]|uniref:hypothetical protein n=1 Tax=Microbacterium sp. JZ31 TaxID=1906274 RepID=UPI0019339732|nr:hypothetical protein [Microbacterium sp. JZ31]